MHKQACSIALRTIIAAALTLAFVTYTPLRLSAAELRYTAVDLKTAQQYVAEASRYDNAIRAIAGIVNVKLDTSDDLKQANTILDRERANLRFRFSKLVILAMNDHTFSSAAKKKIPTKQAAEAFLKELKADPKLILTVDGAQALQTQMRKSSEADAAILRQIADRLKIAAERIRKPTQARTASRLASASELKLVKVGFSEPVTSVNVLEPLAITIIVGVIAFCLLVLAFYALGHLIVSIFTDLGQDALEKCQEHVDDLLVACAAEADRLPFPANIAAKAVCEAEWLARSAACLLLVE